MDVTISCSVRKMEYTHGVLVAEIEKQNFSVDGSIYEDDDINAL